MIDLNNIENLKITQDNFDEVINLMEQKYQETGISPLDPVNKTLYGFNIEPVYTTRRFVTREITNEVLDEELGFYVKEIQVFAVKIGYVYLECCDEEDSFKRMNDILTKKVSLFNEFDLSILYRVLGKDGLKATSPIVDKVWCYLSDDKEGIGINVL